MDETDIDEDKEKSEEEKKVRTRKKNEDEEISEEEESSVDLEESFIGRRIVNTNKCESVNETEDDQ